MKIYSRPETKLIQNEALMAEKCNELFIYTSAGGVSNGYANVCYHYQYYEKSTKQYCVDDYTAKIINIPATGITFKDRTKSGNYTEDGKNYSTSLNTGWADFQGTNGTCHYLGYIYYNGVLIDESNIDQFASGGSVQPIK